MGLTGQDALVAAALLPVARLLEAGVTRDGARAVAYLAEVLGHLAEWMYARCGDGPRMYYDMKADRGRVRADVDHLIEHAMSAEAGMPMPPVEGA